VPTLPDPTANLAATANPDPTANPNPTANPAPTRRPRTRPSDATVIAVASPTPRLKRIRFDWPALAAQDAPEPAPAQWVRAYVPESEAAARLQVGSRELPGRAPRSYTVTEADRAAGRLTLDFVLHGAGPAAQWAAAAKPGDTLPLAGPIGRFRLPPGRTRWLLAGDATALPAIRELLAALPPAAQALALIEAPAGEEQDLASPAHLAVEWLTPEDGGLSARTMPPRTLLPPAWDPLDPAVFAWVAAEAKTTTAIRHHLEDHLALPRTSFQTAAYWRRDTAA
jgi:NADPH-dependent ferric siderophore reductase